MFGSGALEMAIGLVFVYFVLSLICTAIREIIESWLKTRAIDLENGIRELLNDPGGSGLTRKVFEHPIIYGLFRGGYTPPGEGKLYKRGSNLPSYIPPQSFALAIMDIIMPTPAGQAAATPMGSRSFAGSIDNISNEKVKEALRTIVQSAGDDVNKVKEGIEVWFNSTMERVSGWYKQRTQKAVFVIAILVAFSMNADTISIARSLAANATIHYRTHLRPLSRCVFFVHQANYPKFLDISAKICQCILPKLHLLTDRSLT